MWYNLQIIFNSEFQIKQNIKISTYCSFEIWVKNYTTIYIYSHFCIFFYVVKTKIVIL